MRVVRIDQLLVPTELLPALLPMAVQLVLPMYVQLVLLPMVVQLVLPTGWHLLAPMGFGRPPIQVVDLKNQTADLVFRIHVGSGGTHPSRHLVVHSKLPIDQLLELLNMDSSDSDQLDGQVDIFFLVHQHLSTLCYTAMTKKERKVYLTWIK